MALDRTIFWEVDAQVDFMLPGGKLYVPGAEKIIPNFNRLVDLARAGRVLLVSSADAHASDDLEFELFPPHCIRGTPGAQIVPQGLVPNRLTVPNEASFILPTDLLRYQQIVLEKQALDVFTNPDASELVQALGPHVEYVVFGVVTELCVCCAVKGLLQRGVKVQIVRDAIETITFGQGDAALAEMRALGARLISTDQAIAMADGHSPQRVA
jgi:nicotinamidase/pyrazinamidase